MRTHKTLILITIILFALSTSVFGAVFMKIGDIKGETSDQAEEQQQSGENFDRGTTQQPTGMLLPAIQKTRSTAPTDDKATTENDSKAKKKGNIEYQWKVEKGEK